MPRIIIGVDDRERSEDAVAFGAMIARPFDADITLVHAYPADFLGHPEARAYDDFLREDAKATLQQRADPLRDLAGVEMRAMPDHSPARALQKIAEEQHAGLLVVGSSHSGRLGRVLPGSTGERLLHGSPCPVAVVPAGYGTARQSPPQVIACGWDGSPEAETALGAAEEFARATSASLRVVRASEPVFYSYPPKTRRRLRRAAHGPPDAGGAVATRAGRAPRVRRGGRGGAPRGAGDGRAHRGV